MTDSRASLFLCLTSALVVAAFAAQAQGVGQPVPLGPPPGVDSLPEPAGTTLKVVPSPLFETQPAKPREPGTGHFELQELKAPDPEAVGILDDRQGGFGPTMWQGTQAATLRRLLPQIPVANGSRVARALARRLLLTAAAADGGSAGSPPILELRAERLYAMGETEGLAALLKSAPSAITSPALSRLKVDAFLLAGDAKAACAEAATQPGTADSRLQVFCMLSNGKALEANMALDLMRDRKDTDHAFIAAAEAMSGTPPAKVDKLSNPTALHLAAFAAAKLPLPADTAANAPPPLLTAIIASPAASAETRLLAAERAEALGVIDTDALRKLYAGTAFTPEQQQATLTQGDKSPRGRVLLLRAAQAEPAPATRAELVSRLLAASVERGAFAATARLYAPVIAEIKPAPDLAPFAPALARALYAAGRPDTAGNWLALVKSDPGLGRAADDLWALARLGHHGGADTSPPAAIAAWHGARDLPPEAAERRAAITFALLQAVGDQVPAAEWLSLLSGPLASTQPAPKPALKAMLRASAEALRLGETVLLALISLGEGGLDKADPDTLNRAVVFLRMVGLDREARDLAIEAALANGA